MTAREAPVQLTGPQRNALKVLDRHGPVSCPAFAAIMWPNSPDWGVLHNVGRGGSARSTQIVRSAGAYLAKLGKRGWVYRNFVTNEYSITAAGTAALEGQAVS